MSRSILNQRLLEAAVHFENDHGDCWKPSAHTPYHWEKQDGKELYLFIGSHHYGSVIFSREDVAWYAKPSHSEQWTEFVYMGELLDYITGEVSAQGTFRYCADHGCGDLAG